MDVELREIRDFLAATEPFDALPEPAVNGLPRHLGVRYFRRGSTLLALGEQAAELFILRSGAVDVRDENGELRDRREPGATLGSTSAMTGEPLTVTCTAIEDSLVYVLRAELFAELLEAHHEFAEYFRTQRAARLRAALMQAQLADSREPILRARVRDLFRHPPLLVTSSTSVRDCARAMREHDLSAVLVTGDSGEGEVAAPAGGVVGIVTDKDLRNRVLAADVDPASPIATVMTPSPSTTSARSLAFDVLMSMVERNIHHMPVLDAGTVVGVISGSDLLRLQNANPLFLVGDLARQDDVAGVASVSARLPAVVEQLVAQDASADDIARIVTAIGDAVERRLLQLAESALGPPPMPYAWAALGSQARFEQGLHSDQDNALILAQEPDEDASRYFHSLARQVSDGLAECGYPYCNGEVMATNPKWRQSLNAWRRTFTTWVQRPEPMAVMHSTIFFDMRALHGETSLVDTLRRDVLATTPQATAFLVHLAKHAVQRRPPLGVFRGFVLEHEGEHSDTLDLKHDGVAIVVELARVYALSLGLSPVNTLARLAATAKAGKLSQSQVGDLSDAFEFIGYVRLRHQGRQVHARQAPDNHVSPDELSSAERRHLRDAFAVVRRAQSTLAGSFPMQYVS
ncbi:MAG: DUF294 nucleotidyltransferase-like domain-containing protein [Actinomycetales bacterium]